MPQTQCVARRRSYARPAICGRTNTSSTRLRLAAATWGKEGSISRVECSRWPCACRTSAATTSRAAATTFLVVPPYYYFQDGSGGWYRTASLDRFGVPSTEPAAILRFLRSPVLAATERPGENGCRVAMVEIHVDRALAHASPEDRASMAAFAELLELYDDELRADVTLAGDGSLAGIELESVHGRAGLQFFDVGTPLEFSGPPANALDLDTT